MASYNPFNVPQGYYNVPTVPQGFYNVPTVPQVPIDPVIQQIDELIQHLHACLEQRKMELINNYQSIQKDIAARPLARAKKVQELYEYKTHTENLHSNELREMQSGVLSEINFELEKAKNPLPDTRIIFRSDYLPVEQLIAQLGEVKEEEILPLPQFLKEEIAPSPLLLQEVPLVPKYELMRPIVATVKQGRKPGELSDPEGVAIDPRTDNIFVAEGELGRVSIFSQRGEFISCLTHPDMEGLWGVAIHGDSLYVTGNLDTVFKFKIEADFPFLAKVEMKGYQNIEEHILRGIAVSNNGDVYVTDERNNTVFILNSNLQHLRKLTEQLINQPQDIKLTADEVYVLCYDNPCMHVFSYAGVRLRSLISRGYSDDMQVMYSYSFCLDAAENILISDCSAGNIKIFTKEGALIRSIGQEGQSAGEFTRPAGIALSTNLSIVVVSENDNCPLQIFSCNK